MGSNYGHESIVFSRVRTPDPQSCPKKIKCGLIIMTKLMWNTPDWPGRPLVLRSWCRRASPPCGCPHTPAPPQPWTLGTTFTWDPVKIYSRPLDSYVNLYSNIIEHKHKRMHRILILPNINPRVTSLTGYRVAGFFFNSSVKMEYYCIYGIASAGWKRAFLSGAAAGATLLILTHYNR